MDDDLGGHHGSIPGTVKTVSIILLACMFLIDTPGPICAQAWELNLPVPNSDLQWEKARTLYADHYGGKNLTELIATLTPLKEKYPDKIEPYLWLARVHYLHARYIRSDRKEHYAKSEQYAAQACRMDPKNILAIRLLTETLGYSRERSYIFNTYGELIKSFAPLPAMEALPPLPNHALWGAFKPLWEARVDITKAQEAAAIMERMARDYPKDALVQTWAARAVFSVGEYYTSTGEHDARGVPYYKKGIAYAAKARKLQPNSVPANYWYQINLARSIQFTSLLNQARYLMDLFNPLIFCSCENSTYYFSGPIVTLGTMITNAGWVAEKGMRLANITLAMDMNGLEMMEILYPDYYYIPYLRADIMSYKGNKKEAKAILEKLLTRNPNVNPLIPENHNFIRMARTLYHDIQNGKR
jgi:tetratricopeptide (TPR) repeat protein